MEGLGNPPQTIDRVTAQREIIEARRTYREAFAHFMRSQGMPANTQTVNDIDKKSAITIEADASENEAKINLPPLLEEMFIKSNSGFIVQHVAATPHQVTFDLGGSKTPYDVADGQTTFLDLDKKTWYQGDQQMGAVTPEMFRGLASFLETLEGRQDTKLILKKAPR